MHMKKLPTLVIAGALSLLGASCTTVVKEDDKPDVIQKTSSYERSVSSYPGTGSSYRKEESTTTTALD